MPHPNLPNVVKDVFRIPDAATVGDRIAHPPRILLLYGSVRKRSYSRFATQEAARLLEEFGAETQDIRSVRPAVA